MSTKLKQITITIIATTLAIGGVILAGSLTPGGNTSTPTFYTLSDIYNKLNLNTYSASTHTVSTTSLPTTGTMHTLTEIWTAIPTVNYDNLLNTYSIMGATGTIAVKTNDTAVVTTSTSTNKLLLTVPAGYYGGSATVSTTSTAFTNTNIANGVNLFGITGTLSGGYTYGSTSASGVLYSTAPGAGTANNPAGATGGRTLADATKVISDSFAFSTDGTIINGTGSAGVPALVWQADDTATDYYTWADAVTHCAGLNSGGFSSGWRLPTSGEMAKAISDCNVERDSQGQPNGQSTPCRWIGGWEYWTSYNPFLSPNAYTLSGTASGLIENIRSMTATYSVRCIH